MKAKLPNNLLAIPVAGIDFIEFSTHDKETVTCQLETFGFSPIAHHHREDVTIYQQNDIRIVVNRAAQSLAEQHSDMYGFSVSAIGLLVPDAKMAYQQALEHAVLPYDANDLFMCDVYGVPAIYALGNSLIYFVDYQKEKPNYAVCFSHLPSSNPEGIGLTGIDHMTYAVREETLEDWRNYYARLFNFNKVKINLKTTSFYNSYQEDYLNILENEGVEHIAFNSENMPQSIKLLWDRGVEYFVDLSHAANVKDICCLAKKNDMQPKSLQIFAPTRVGSLFFELVQHDHVETVTNEVRALTDMRRLAIPEKNV